VTERLIQSALISGAASGIGRATAIAFAQQGTAVGLIDINAEALEQTANEIKKAGGKVFWLAGTIASSVDVEEFVSQAAKKFGRIDFLFNNAGEEFISPLADTKEEDWDRVVDTNLKGTFLMSRAALKYMLPNKFGVIINNASDAGLRGIKLNAAYSSSKAAIIHLTRSMSLDYAAEGIRTNCICPGCIRTPLCERFNAEVGARKGITGEQALQDFVEDNIPMRRVGTAEEVAKVVLFLCSDDAAYINGAILPIDGGLTAGM
jgi:NAD(P)-dependent dehydrogenase (short-subunit alcohol dehydrogenase family)